MKEQQLRQKDGRFITLYDFTDEVPAPEQDDRRWTPTVVPFKEKENA